MTDLGIARRELVEHAVVGLDRRRAAEVAGRARVVAELGHQRGERLNAFAPAARGGRTLADLRDDRGRDAAESHAEAARTVLLLHRLDQELREPGVAAREFL